MKYIFNLKKLLMLFIILLCTFALSSCGNNDNKSKQFDWSEIELHQILPEPSTTHGDFSRNSKEGLSLDLYGIDKATFKDYKDECIKMGFTIDSEDSDTTYTAFNENGYFVRLVFLDSNQEISVVLDAPEEMNEFEWPTHGLGTMLPKTKSTLGDISWDNSENFIVHVGNTTIDDYKEYVKACENEGYVIDYSKDDEYYSAKNSSGYKLALMYLGFNKIEISLEAPEGMPEKNPEKNNADNDGLDPDFKAAMDDYEKFMDNYVAFMKKYNANPTDMTLLADYAKFMSDYADFCNDFAAWEDEDLSTAETAYYLDVQTRVTKKLLEIAQ